MLKRNTIEQIRTEKKRRNVEPNKTGNKTTNQSMLVTHFHPEEALTMPMSRAAKMPKKNPAVTGVGSIGLLGRIWFYFTEPAAYHCKPICSEHDWVRSEIMEFPVCKKCNKVCWWMDGYTLNSGTVLKPDIAAQMVQRPNAAHEPTAINEQGD